MPWVESVVQEVWTSKGALKVNERVELSDEEAESLKERGQVIIVEDGEPGPVLEADDPEDEEEE